MIFLIGGWAVFETLWAVNKARDKYGAAPPFAHDIILACQDRLRQRIADTLSAEQSFSTYKNPPSNLLELADQCVALSPKNPYSLSLRSAVHLHNNHVDEAVADLSASLVTGPLEVELPEARLATIVALFPRLSPAMQSNARLTTAWIAAKRTKSAAIVAMQSPDHIIFIRQSIISVHGLDSIQVVHFDRALKALRKRRTSFGLLP